MKPILIRSVRAIGEAMVEMAPVGGGLYRRGFAGDTFNTAWHMAQWLGSYAEVGFVTRVGQDRLSEDFVRTIVEDGLVATYVSRDPVRTMGLYLIELDGAERSFQYWREFSAARLLADDLEHLNTALLGAGLVHLSGITLAILSAEAREKLIDVLSCFRSRGGVVSFDANVRPRLWSSADEMRQTMTSMLSCVDIAMPSLDDERTHFGDRSADETIDRIAAFGPSEVVVKDGAGPVRLLWNGARETMATPPAKVVLDTTGAGDAFNAGYLAERLAGSDPVGCVAAGQTMAAAVLAEYGARASKQAIASLPRPVSHGTI